MFIYKFMAELFSDVKPSIENIPGATYIIAPFASDLPDVEVELTVNLPLHAACQESMAIPDGYAMVQTLAVMPLYTGERISSR